MLKDFIQVNKKALANTFASIKYLPILALVIFVLTVAGNVISVFFVSSIGGIDFILGIIKYVVSVAITSALISVLEDLVLYKRFKFNNFSQGFTRFLGPLLNILFYMWLIEMAASFLGGAIPYIGIITMVVINVINSNLYEQVYIGGRYDFSAITESINFIKENFLYWIIPMILYVIMQTGFTLVSSLSIFNFNGVIGSVAFAMGLAFIHLYKGHMFKILYNSSRRKRQFEGMFN